MSFVETFMEQLNSPECSAISGAYIGMGFSLRLVLTVVIMYFILKAVDTFAFEPFIHWLKEKTQNNKKGKAK